VHQEGLCVKVRLQNTQHSTFNTQVKGEGKREKAKGRRVNRISNKEQGMSNFQVMINI